jgi:hypothetical protein
MSMQQRPAPSGSGTSSGLQYHSTGRKSYKNTQQSQMQLSHPNLIPFIGGNDGQ